MWKRGIHMENNVENVRYHTDKIAILLATYNGEQYLREQLDSLLAQTCQDWVTYIHDDGSTDQTMALIEEYAERYPQKFIKVDGVSTGGAKKNFFYLLSCVDAPYLMCCDQDDVWLPDKIEVTFQAMKQIEQECTDSGKQEKEIPLLVFTELRVVDGQLNTIAERMSEIQQLECHRKRVEDIVVQNHVTGCTMMINRCLLRMMNGCNPQHAIDLDQVIMHDWWCALIAAEYGQIKFIEQPTILYRQHGDNSVGAKNVRSAGYVAEKLAKLGEIKASLELTRKQAAEFQRSFRLPEEHVVSRYGQIGRQNKIARLKFYKENHISKSGKFRQIGFLIFG